MHRITTQLTAAIIFGFHFPTNAAMIGADANFPGYSAADILMQSSNRGDGLYWIDPDLIGLYAVSSGT